MFRICVALLVLLLLAAPAPAGIMIQSFEYDQNPPPGKTWWQHLADIAPLLRELGVTGVWLPPPTKGSSGGYSSGYDPYDFYDLGSKDQQGSVATRFGTKQQLLDLIGILHANGIDAYLDIVPNHRAGGKEWGYVYDDLQGSEALGRFPMGHRDFHKYGHTDFDMDLGGRDLKHEEPYVRDGFFSWIRWLDKQTGCDGYRIDAAKHMDPGFIEGLLYQVQEGSGQGRYAFSEYYDANPWTLGGYVHNTKRRTSVSDFALFFNLVGMSLGNGYYDMRNLRNHFYDYEKSVTFVNSHDTYRRGNGLQVSWRANLAYAYILSAPGYPVVFLPDLLDEHGRPRDYLVNLMWINTFLAHGRRIERWADDDLYVMEREGNLIAAFNDNTTAWRDVFVPTAFGPGVRLHDYAGDVTERWTNEHGWVKVSVPPSGYVMYGRDGLQGQRPAPQRRRTEQEYQGAPDMDLRPVGEWWSDQTIRFPSEAGELVVVNLHLENRTVMGHLALFDDQGRLLNHSTGGNGQVYLEYRQAPRAGYYQVRMGLHQTGRGERSRYWLKVSHRAPAQRPVFFPPDGNTDANLPPLR